MRGINDDVRNLLLELIRRKIASRAYELYLERGGAAGGALDDWLKAEDEVLAQSISMPLYPKRKDSSV